MIPLDPTLAASLRIARADFLAKRIWLDGAVRAIDLLLRFETAPAEDGLAPASAGEPLAKERAPDGPLDRLYRCSQCRDTGTWRKPSGLGLGFDVVPCPCKRMNAAEGQT